MAARRQRRLARGETGDGEHRCYNRIFAEYDFHNGSHPWTLNTPSLDGDAAELGSFQFQTMDQMAIASPR